jgi:hypothetical protein
LQRVLFGTGLLGAATGLGAKSNLALTRETGAYIQFEYWLSRIDQAGLQASIYWLATGVFLGSVLVLMIIEAIQQRRQ